jgi:dolichol-phosphate mannosyltransferase
MLEHIASYDVVVGSRYVAGGQVDERWETGRFLLSWWANAVYARLLLNLSVRDTTAGFKCWRAETLRGIDYNHVGSHGYSFQVEMAYLAEKLGYRALEIPIYFEDRRIGKSKMSIPIKIEAALRVWQILWRYRKLSPHSRVQPVDESSGSESG